MNATLNLPEVEENGLTASQVRACEESGQTNAVKSTTSRSILDIVRANVFTLFNGIIFAAMVLVLITGSWKDAVFGFVILINTGIGIVTELKAKRTLDRLSILVTSDYAVRRDGKNTEVPRATSYSATCCGYVPGSRCRLTRRSCHHTGSNSTNRC